MKPEDLVEFAESMLDLLPVRAGRAVIVNAVFALDGTGRHDAAAQLVQMFTASGAAAIVMEGAEETVKEMIEVIEARFKK